jgi:plastocyanin
VVPEPVLARACGVAVAGLLMAGTAASTAPVASTAQARVINIENLQFNPQNLAVKSGERITWVNKDLFPHTATADAKAFDSKSIAPNGTWTWVARKPGTYSYVCTFHPTMKGTVTVQ